jgi:hypothetical protein
MAERLSAMIRSRIHQEFDGECHLTAAEAENIAVILDHVEEISETHRPIAWMDAKCRVITDATKRAWGDQSYTVALYDCPHVHLEPPVRETDEPVAWAYYHDGLNAGLEPIVYASRQPGNTAAKGWREIALGPLARPQSPKSPDRDALVEALREAERALRVAGDFIYSKNDGDGTLGLIDAAIAKIDAALSGEGKG